MINAGKVMIKGARCLGVSPQITGAINNAKYPKVSGEKTLPNINPGFRNKLVTISKTESPR